jgi:hypothetical protein
VRRICWHTEGDDVVALAVELEFGGMVAFVAIKDQKPVDPPRTAGCMLIKVLDKLKASFIIGPAILSRVDTPGSW